MLPSDKASVSLPEIQLLAVVVKSAVANFVPILVVIVVAKLGSSSKADASSLSVFKVAGADETKSLTAPSTYSVLAILVELLLADCVGTVGFPVKFGLDNGA